MGRPAGALTNLPVEATLRTLKAEAAARFLATFRVPWDAMWAARVGAVGAQVSRAIRSTKRERRLRGALDRLRTAARHAIRVAELEPALRELDESHTTTDALAATLVRLVTKLPAALVAPEPPWAQGRAQSLRAVVAANAPKAAGRPLTPREFAFIGVLAGVKPTVRKDGKHLESVQSVLEREANAYARMSQRRKKP